MPTKQQERPKEILDLTERFERESKAADRRIDQLVDEVHELTKQETDIVEEAVGK